MQPLISLSFSVKRCPFCCPNPDPLDFFHIKVVWEGATLCIKTAKFGTLRFPDFQGVATVYLHTKVLSVQKQDHHCPKLRSEASSPIFIVYPKGVKIPTDEEAYAKLIEKGDLRGLYRLAQRARATPANLLKTIQKNQCVYVLAVLDSGVVPDEACFNAAIELKNWEMIQLLAGKGEATLNNLKNAIRSLDYRCIKAILKSGVLADIECLHLANSLNIKWFQISRIMVSDMSNKVDIYK